MSKIDKNTLLGKILSSFARDAEPEELAEASKMMQGTSDTEPPAADPPAAPPAVEPAKDEEPNVAAALQGLLETVKSLQADIAALKAGGVQDESPEKALDELEKEFGADEEAKPAPEETGTISDEAPVAPAESLPENPIPGADSKAVILAALKSMRPIVAQIADPAERKKAADAMAKSFREQLQVQPTNNYRKMARPQQLKKAQDSAVDQGELGRAWAKKWNPHYKNRE